MEPQQSPTGRQFFWSVWSEPTGDAEGTDVHAVEQGSVAVTPLRVGEFDQTTFDAWRTKFTSK
jgi:broad specificity polyphosphatase/5'/3'-nucleotidase SurE